MSKSQIVETVKQFLILKIVPYLFQKWMIILFNFQSVASAISACYHVVAVAVDRFLLIKFPFWHRGETSARSGKKTSFFITLFSYLISVPMLICVNPLTGYCEVKSKHFAFIGPSVDGFYLLAVGFFPCVSLLVFSIIFVQTLKHYNKFVAEELADQPANEQRQIRLKRERESVMMVFLLSASYLLFSLLSLICCLLIIPTKPGRRAQNIVKLLGNPKPN